MTALNERQEFIFWLNILIGINLFILTPEHGNQYFKSPPNIRNSNLAVINFRFESLISLIFQIDPPLIYLCDRCLANSSSRFNSSFFYSISRSIFSFSNPSIYFSNSCSSLSFSFLSATVVDKISCTKQ